MEIFKSKGIHLEGKIKFAGKVLDVLDDRIDFQRDEGRTLLKGLALGTAVVLFLEFADKKLNPPKKPQ